MFLYYSTASDLHHLMMTNFMKHKYMFVNMMFTIQQISVWVTSADVHCVWIKTSGTYMFSSNVFRDTESLSTGFNWSDLRTVSLESDPIESVPNVVLNMSMSLCCLLTADPCQHNMFWSIWCRFRVPVWCHTVGPRPGPQEQDYRNRTTRPQDYRTTGPPPPLWSLPLHRFPTLIGFTPLSSSGQRKCATFN